MTDKITVLVPVYNEEGCLGETHRRLSELFKTLDVRCEMLFVNDGSSDNSLSIIRALAQQDPQVSYINLSRNFGKEAAMSAGLDLVDADAVVIIDADLQDPPELIPKMIELWREGYDNIYGQRTERRGESAVKKLTAKYFYKVIKRVSRVNIPRDTGDFRLLSRRAVTALRQLPESNRFMKGLFAWVGYRQIALPYQRDARFEGTSTFNYWNLWNFALDGITSFTTLPLKIASYLGLLIAFSAIITGSFIVAKTLIYGDPVPGYPSLMTVVLFLGGMQLLFLGVLGEYLGRMFSETKRRPLYLVEKHHRGSASVDEEPPQTGVKG
ncbi:glycosyltransferase family 2 protein [Marinimicrobium alkaliphilum]|uniref:glycosyltransferase family 2 protein n=1 Tax=Marinimicrobium alkaliphilum TaxID=2202654 RepID=UPI000DB93C72|nr:glycosyltransferase family 2 protein [Marinimicrobium alkaliphilum]